METRIFQIVKFFLPLIVFFYCFSYIFFGERLPVRGGLGWDGTLYTTYAVDFFNVIKQHGISDYHWNRLLPSFIIYLSSKIFNIKFYSPGQVFSIFALYNSLLLTLASYLWIKISKKENFSMQIFWIGFFSLFLNCAIASQYQYVAIQTDITAFFFGMILLYFYVFDRPVLLCLVTFLASLTWPIAIYFSFLLLLRKPKNEQMVRSIEDKIACYLILAVFLANLIYFNLIEPLPFNVHAAQLNKNLFWMSSIFALFYVWYVLSIMHFFTQLKIQLKSITHYLKDLNIYVYMGMFIAYTLLHYYLIANYGVPSPYGLQKFLASTFIQTPVAKPAVFLIAHIVYFGPIMILAMLTFKETIIESLRSGFGLFVFYFLTLLLALNSESRFLIFNYPFVVYIVCRATTNFKIDNRLVIVFGLLSFILSKIYFHINSEPFSGLYTDFPWQRYFMTYGPWMGDKGYLINVALTLFAVITLSYFYLRANKKATYRLLPTFIRKRNLDATE